MELNEEKDEITYYQFISELKSFLRDLLQHPVKSNIGDFFKNIPFKNGKKGVTKGKFIEYLIKTGIIEKTEKVNTDDPENITLDISYRIPKKGFERKIQKMYIKLFEIKENIDTDFDKLFLTEGLSDLLYHFTSIDNLISILKSNTLQDNSDQSRDMFYYSFSRVKNANMGFARYENSNVRITFDGRMLGYNFKGGAFDFFKNPTFSKEDELLQKYSGKERRQISDLNNKRDYSDEKSRLNKETEFEDRIEISNKKVNPFSKIIQRFDSGVEIINISKYIIRIDIYMDDSYYDNQSGIKELLNLSKLKISNLIYIYGDRRSFDFQSPKHNEKLLDIINDLI
jgi:hypothetical protein